MPNPQIPEAGGNISGAKKSLVSARAMVVAIVVILLAVATWYLIPRAPKLTAQDPVVVGDFINSTSDSIFEGTLRPGLAAQLQQTPFLNIVPEDKIDATLRDVGQAPGGRLTKDITRQVCQRLGAFAAITGEVGLSEDGYAMNFEAVNCKTGELIVREETTSMDKQHAMDAIAEAAADFREDIGEPRSSRSEFNRKAEMVTTKSLAALQDYSQGLDAEFFSSDPAVAIALFQKSISLDANFSLAHLELGRAYARSGDAAKARAEYDEFFRLWAGADPASPFLLAAKSESAKLG